MQGKDENLWISSLLSSSASEIEFHGWNILGWFHEPTEVGYEIDVTEEAP